MPISWAGEVLKLRLQKLQQLGMRRKPRFLDLEHPVVFLLFYQTGNLHAVTGEQLLAS